MNFYFSEVGKIIFHFEDLGQLSLNPLKKFRLIVESFIVRINLKTVCQHSFKDCQYYFKGSILKNPDIFKKILTHFKKILTPFKKILTLFKKILTSPFVRIFVPHLPSDKIVLLEIELFLSTFARQLKRILFSYISFNMA